MKKAKEVLDMVYTDACPYTGTLSEETRAALNKFYGYDDSE